MFSLFLEFLIWLNYLKYCAISLSAHLFHIVHFIYSQSQSFILFWKFTFNCWFINAVLFKLVIEFIIFTIQLDLVCTDINVNIFCWRFFRNFKNNFHFVYTIFVNILYFVIWSILVASHFHYNRFLFICIWFLIVDSWNHDLGFLSFFLLAHRFPDLLFFFLCWHENIFLFELTLFLFLNFIPHPF